MNKNFPKIQMRGGLPGRGMLKLPFDWYIKSHNCLNNNFNNKAPNSLTSR